jgi:ubiquinone/menaquinone biosynthesis C-methylase UbiE
VNQSNYRDIVRNCYLKFLNREPDDEGWNSYVRQMETKEIDENKLIEIFKNSLEYKLAYPIELDKNTPIDIKMKKEWDARAKANPLFVIATDHSKSEDDFWNSGIKESKKILGIGTHRFQEITKNKDPSKMRILEIGCGIGRILLPMSKIFGESIGIDISSEMVQQGQKHIVNIPNCKILENDGIDLALFSDNDFDFCYSFIVFQHIPDKKIVENYINEVSRILKPECLFRFQVRGTISTKPQEVTTWDGVQFSSKEIHEMATKYNFDIIEEGDDKSEYYWLTFKLKNRIYN